jgi:hypothetical protein
MKVVLIALFFLLGLNACAQKSMIEDGSYERANSANDRAQSSLSRD